MGRRKKKAEEHENHERWLVSYADFITLLFAFFTSMYAISSVNEGKFRILSEALAVAFNPSMYTSSRALEGPRFIREQRSNVSNEFKKMFTSDYQRLQSALREFEQDKKLSLLVDEMGVTIRITEGALFKPGGDEFELEALYVVDEIAQVLKEFNNDIRIEGHTDDIPISTERFPSNWDLSSSRAIKIMKRFVQNHEYEPKKLTAIGYGEFRPVAPNDTPAGRTKNRRVDILLLNPGATGAR